MERRYTIDLPKLQAALDGKRRKHNHTWLLISNRLGVAPTTLKSMTRPSHSNKNKGSIDGNVLAGVLMYLQRPITDFIVENKEVGNNGGQQNGSLEVRGSSPTSVG